MNQERSKKRASEHSMHALRWYDLWYKPVLILMANCDWLATWPGTNGGRRGGHGTRSADIFLLRGILHAALAA